MRPSLDVQLKATVRLGESEEDELRYPLPRRNYDLLREQTLVPRILVVLDLPREEEQWLDVSAEALVMRRCAYWVDIAGFPETANKETVTVAIGKQNRLDIGSLKNLMERARKGAMS